MPKQVDKNVIRTKWVLRKKMDKIEVVMNKARLVSKGYAQDVHLDYGEKFSPMAILEGVRKILAFVSYKGSKFYQMYVKSKFLDGILEEEHT